MEAGVAMPDLPDDELDAAIESISALSGETSPTEYTIDLSALSNPPLLNNPGRKVSPSLSKPRHARKRSQAPRVASPPLPSSPPPEALNSDDVDGPEDFTINMAYWMRCNLNGNTASDKKASEVQEQREASSLDVSIAQAMDTWASRGSDRLKTLVAERLAAAPQEILGVEHQLSGGEVDKGVPGGTDHPQTVSSAGDGEMHLVTKPVYEDDAFLGTEDLASDLSRRKPTVEDYFSSPVRPGAMSPQRASPFQGLNEAQGRIDDDQNNLTHAENAHWPTSSAVVEHTLHRVADLETELRSLRAQLAHSRREFQRAGNNMPPASLEMQTNVRSMDGLQPPDTDRNFACAAVKGQPSALESRSPVISSQQEHLQTMPAQESLSMQNEAANSLLDQASLVPIPASSIPSVLEFETNSETLPPNGPNTDRKIAQLLGVPVLPSTSHVTTIVPLYEAKIRDLQERIRLVCDEKAALIEGHDIEKARWISEMIEHREISAMQQADHEARLSFLREELAQRAAESADYKRQLDAVQQDAESSADLLRVRDEEAAGEIRVLKARLAASDATCQEQHRKLGRVEAENRETQQQIQRLQQRNREFERQYPAMEATADRSIGQAGNTTGSENTQLERERSHNDVLTREVSELKDEIDLLREQLRVSALDGNGENRPRDSGINMENSALEQSTMSMQGELQNLREELRGQIRAATDARAEARTAQKELEKARVDLAQVRRALDVSEEKSAEVEKRVGEILRSRDAEIKRRIRELKGEKKQMGRALMRSWGERECGEDVPQRYRYAF